MTGSRIHTLVTSFSPNTLMSDSTSVAAKIKKLSVPVIVAIVLFAILILGGSITAIYIGTKNPDRSADETSKLSKPPDKTQLFINQIKDDIANFKGEVLNLKSQHYLKSVDI